MEQRLQIKIHGAVQGVGFRPFVYNLANQLELKGYVQNNSSGLLVEAEGELSLLNLFLNRIQKEKPCNSIINSFDFSYSDKVGFSTFEIKKSKTDNSNVSALLLPDIAICSDCLKELFDENSRRYLYPFINCTNCGPRFSIIKSLPYDRQNTTMDKFRMCDKCKEEYEDPSDRRFHAQPIACPDCGPQAELWNEKGSKIASRNKAIETASDLIKRGKIIALKGLGGFQLIADAQNDGAVYQLRKRKRRDEKPFALMFPDIESVRRVCFVEESEEMLLQSMESPIVLLRKKTDRKKDDAEIHSLQIMDRQIMDGRVMDGQKQISYYAAPGNPYLGVMLPYTPLHHLLMKQTGIPIIATSGNLTEEPMCTDEHEALERLSGIADYYLIHNRPIERYIDDSVVRILKNRIMILRRARGYAPLPMAIKTQFQSRTVLAVGGQMKNSVAINVKSNVFISQHIGDLINEQAMGGFQKAIIDLKNIYHTKPDVTVCDLHPDYLSTKFVESNYSDPLFVQHHIAHLASCRAENQVEGSALGVVWDGTGYGSDGTIWGGEFFLTDGKYYEHFASLRKFQLLGAEAAVKDTRRAALGVLFEIFGSDLWKMQPELFKYFSKNELEIFKKMLECNINCAATSSMGRLFDAAAAMAGLTVRSAYEGHAAMMLEFAAETEELKSYHFNIESNVKSENNSKTENKIKSENKIKPENRFRTEHKFNGESNLKTEKKYIIDWGPMFKEILSEKKQKTAPAIISAKFHNTLVNIIHEAAKYSREKKVILSGGCFQNILLLEKTIERLEADGYKVYWQQKVPTNDGGIALGQIAYAFNQMK